MTLIVGEGLSASIHQSQNSKIKTVTLVEALSEKLKLSSREILDKWGETLKFSDEPDFRTRFSNSGINFYQADSTELKNSEIYVKSLNPKLCLIVTADQVNRQELQMKENVILITDKNYLQPRYCPTENCLFSSRRKCNFDDHVKTCSSESKTRFKEKFFGCDKDVKAELIDLGLISADECPYKYCTWDIETLFQKEGIDLEFSKVQGIASVVSIAIYSPEFQTVLVRESDEPDAPKKLIEKFVQTLESIQSAHADSVKPEIKRYYSYCTEELKKDNISVSDQNKYRNHKQFLQKMFTLHVVAFNSGRFDIPVIMSRLVETIPVEKLSVIKNGNKYIMVKFDDLLFLDAVNYFPQGSLVDFCKSFGVEEHKTIFPYERFQTVSEMKNLKTYPKISDFFSSLGRKGDRNLFFQEFLEISKNFASLNETLSFLGIDLTVFYDEIDETEKQTLMESLHVSPKLFYEEKTKFIENMENGTFSSFLCVLKSYNLNDCLVLYRAVQNFQDTVSKLFSVDLFSKISLPGLSESIMWKMINTDQGHISSVGQDWGHLNTKIRGGLMGGPCIPFVRHIELENFGDYEKCVYYTPSGERFKRVTSLDFNGKIKVH